VDTHHTQYSNHWIHLWTRQSNSGSRRDGALGVIPNGGTIGALDVEGILGEEALQKRTAE